MYILDEAGEIPMGFNVVFNAGPQRPAVCNAMETLLVHKDIAAEFLPALAEKPREKPVEPERLPTRTCAIPQRSGARHRGRLSTEYLDLIMAVKS